MLSKLIEEVKEQMSFDTRQAITYIESTVKERVKYETKGPATIKKCSVCFGLGVDKHTGIACLICKGSGFRSIKES